MDKKRMEAILLRSTNVWYFGEGMFGPLLAIFTGSIGGDILDITWAWAIFLAVTGLATILIGYIADKKKGFTEELLLIGYALNALFTFGYLFIDTSYGLFFIESGLGLAAAFATPTWDALYSKYEDKKNPTFTWAKHEGQYRLITGAGIVLGGFIVSYISFDMLFAIMGIIQVIAFISQASLFWRNRDFLKEIG